MKRYNKLVRDKIPDVIRRNGGNPSFHIAVCLEFEYQLNNKLREEVEEFCKSVSPEEIADILEVIEAICKYHGFSRGKIDKLKKKKARNNGKFNKRVILEEA